MNPADFAACAHICYGDSLEAIIPKLLLPRHDAVYHPRMYTPSSFRQHRVEELYAFIREHPLAAIVTGGLHGIEATHVPVVLHEGASTPPVLRCHFARANGHWRSIQPGTPVLAIFQGPEHYVSPSWYPTKEETGRVVPTWNYVAVHVRGRASLFEDLDRLLAHVGALTAEHESGFEKPWPVSAAPEDYVNALAKAIVGVEILVDSIEGKWKLSQNRSEQDQRGVMAGLRNLNSPKSLEVLKLMEKQTSE